MKIEILTLFPKMFEGPLSESILKRALEDKKIEIVVHNLRDWAQDKHKTADLPPYGGGPGMVMKVDVIDKAVEDLRQKKSRVILLDTKGPIYTQKKAKKLSKIEHLILIAGHYEGVDHRVHKHIVDEVISIGEYVLTGGEIPVMVVVDSVVRLLPKVLGNSESLEGESYNQGSDRSAPKYTRPEKYKTWKVPKVLLSGDHKKIEEWKKNQTV
jgi:tRNA (guanine37-N1)-methyltransferase